MFAIVEACGRQYQLEAGRFVDLDLQAHGEGDSFSFDKVLMIVDGASSTIGAPYIDGAKVTGRVLNHGRGAKIIVYRMRKKKGWRKKQGHRQEFTRVVIDSIELKDKVLAKADEHKSKEPAKKAAGAPSAKASKAGAAAPKAKAQAPKKDAKASSKGADAAKKTTKKSG